MEQESVIPLFVDGEDLPPRLPLVGELLEKMFKRQKIHFTKVWLTVEKLFSINFVIRAHMIVYPGALETLNSNRKITVLCTCCYAKYNVPILLLFGLGVI